MNPGGATTAVALLVVACSGAAAKPMSDANAGSSVGVAVYALSKGKGVPSATRETLRKARALLDDLQREKKVTALEQSRVGLEGETRLCAEFADEKTAREAVEKLRELARGVELMNVVEESCRKSQ